MSQFSAGIGGATAPGYSEVLVTPSDSVDLPGGITRGLYIDVAGIIKYTTANGEVVTKAALAIGMIHPIRVKRIWASVTTATGIFAVY